MESIRAKDALKLYFEQITKIYADLSTINTNYSLPNGDKTAELSKKFHRELGILLERYEAEAEHICNQI